MSGHSSRLGCGDLDSVGRATAIRPARSVSGSLVLVLFARRGYHARMSAPADALTPATAEDVANALAFALRFSGRKRVHNADEFMSSIVAKRLAEHLERSGFVVMKRPPIGGSARAYPGEAAP
jgi:hypothetical protein